MPAIQLVQTVVIKRDRSPAAKDGAAALATLTELDNGNAPSKKELAASGFREESPGLWVHDDGSWVKTDPLDSYNPLQFGIGTDRLDARPELRPRADPSAKASDTRPSLKDKPWSWFKKNVAIGKIDGKIQDDPLGKNELMRAGFVVSARRGTSETWVHPDGSWLKSDFNGSGMQLGWKGYSQVEIQYGASVPKDLKSLLTERATIPRTMRNHALAKIGIVNYSTVHATCTNAGFVKVGSHYIHPDGSWVKNDNGYLSVGWKAYGLDRLPYRQGWL